MIEMVFETVLMYSWGTWWNNYHLCSSSPTTSHYSTTAFSYLLSQPTFPPSERIALVERMLEDCVQTERMHWTTASIRSFSSLLQTKLPYAVCWLE